jgi:hypothetical protein
MVRKGVLSSADVVRVVASFIFINVMFTIFIPLELVCIVTCNAVLLLFLALFVVIRSGDRGGTREEPR